MKLLDPSNRQPPNVAIISGLPWHYTESDGMRDLSFYGFPKCLRFYEDGRNGASRGILLVEFDRAEPLYQLKNSLMQLSGYPVVLRLYHFVGNWDRAGRLPPLPSIYEDMHPTAVVERSQGQQHQGLLPQQQQQPLVGGIAGGHMQLPVMVGGALLQHALPPPGRGAGIGILAVPPSHDPPPFQATSHEVSSAMLGLPPPRYHMPTSSSSGTEVLLPPPPPHGMQPLGHHPAGSPQSDSHSRPPPPPFPGSTEAGTPSSSLGVGNSALNGASAMAVDQPPRSCGSAAVADGVVAGSWGVANTCTPGGWAEVLNIRKRLRASEGGEQAEAEAEV